MAKRSPKLKTEPISWKQLFSGKRRGEAFFHSAERHLTLVEKRDGLLRSHDLTEPRGYPEHNNFLRNHRGNINTFADIGCDVAFGAPTTVEARNALGEKAKVYAIDAVAPSVRTQGKTERQGLQIKLHNIVKGPLPFQCDAIGFRNVAQWMSQSDRRRALVNIWDSLKSGGFLLGGTAGRKYKKGKRNEGFILRKTARGWEEIILD